MTLWDASQLQLINGDLALEDPSSPAGRVWHECVLHYAQSRPANVGVQWQRCQTDASLVYLLRGWSDAASQANYRDQSLAATLMDVYLARPSQWLPVASREDFLREHAVCEPLYSIPQDLTPSQPITAAVPSQLSDLFTASRSDLDAWRTAVGKPAAASEYEGPQLSWRLPTASAASPCFAPDGTAAAPRPQATTPSPAAVTSVERPMHGKWMETVELRLRGGAGDGAVGLAHRRALHYYMLHFCESTGTDSHLSPAVESTTLMHVWLTDSNYLARFFIATPDARAAWVRDFARRGYEMLGSRAHAIGCVAEVVASKTEFVHGIVPAAGGH